MNATQIETEIARLRRLPYTLEVMAEDDGSWFARVVEFPGCITVGDSREEALEMLDDAMASWIEAKLEANEPIPQPMAAGGYSGKFVVRVAKSLHRDLARTAEANGVSLNQFVSTVLAQAVGRIDSNFMMQKQVLHHSIAAQLYAKSNICDIRDHAVFVKPSLISGQLSCNLPHEVRVDVDSCSLHKEGPYRRDKSVK